MFNFKNKKTDPAPKPNKPVGHPVGSKPKNVAMFGLLDMGFGVDEGSLEENDDDLEAELLALTQGPPQNRGKKGGKKLVTDKELAAMVSSSMADIPSDAEVSDIDDAEVEDELMELCHNDEEVVALDSSTKGDKTVASPNTEEIISILNERMAMYQLAEKNSAEKGDTMKCRRLGRGIKSLNELLKQAQAGKSILVEDIPPPLAESYKNVQKLDVSSNVENKDEGQNSEIKPFRNEDPNSTIKPLIPVRIAPPPPSLPPPIPPRHLPIQPTQDNTNRDPSHLSGLSDIEKGVARRQELKNAALEAKRSGNQSEALKLVRLVKICDQMIDAAKQGSSVDWSQLPSLDIAEESLSHVKLPAENLEKETKGNDITRMDVSPPSVDAVKEPTVPVETPTVSTIPIPRNTLEALEQRLEKYQSVMKQAQEEGNSSKARRFGRIVKQYQDAIKFYKLGKPVPFDELPDPPGYPPIPGAPEKKEDLGAPLPETSKPQNVAEEAKDSSVPEKSTSTGPSVGGPKPTVPPKPSPKKTALATRQDKQLALLLERQNMFKQAALEAKKSGDVELAKDYLRMAKGIDPLISANKCGVPVDMDTLPIPPQMKQRFNSSKDGSSKPGKSSADDFVILSSEECVVIPSLENNSSGILGQLEADLLVQLKMCLDNRDHYKSMGDIANANRFDQLALHTRKDLDVVRSSAMRGDSIPRFKNEMRTFSIVKCCTDLKDDDMEVTILKGLSYNVANPKTIDTYVRFEVPIPNSDNPTQEKTKTVKDTNSPEYNETFHVTISRQSRTLLRIFKSKNIKFEVWSKGGFLRSDTLIGTATIKLADLLNHCQIHQAADLMDGRKAVGGKVEVKIRIRDPIVGKEMEQVQEKWTVLTS